MVKKPLAGIKVVGLTWYVTGPQITKTLAAYGAEVVKIEGHTRHDPGREYPPYKDNIAGLNRCGDFNSYNTGNLSIALNLAKPRGIEIVKRLVARADVVVDNFAGQAMPRMGLGYEELRKVKPDIIMLSACMQGQTGPYATLPGSGGHLVALSGFTYITGWPDRQPAGPHGPYTDYIGPRFCLTAILAALDYRRRTGKGQYIDVSQYETSIHFLAPLLLDYTVNGRVAGGMGNRCSYAAPHGAYRCHGKDRWCAIAVFSDGEWSSFRKVIGNPPWSKDPRFGTLLGRKKNEDELDRLVEEWTVNYPAEQVMTMMQSAGVAAGVLETNQDMMEHDPQLKHRHFFRELDHPETGPYHAPGSAFNLSRATYELKRAPLLGEHNEYVLKELLSMSDSEIAKLSAEGVLE
ncbi:MAG: CoA transferase [Chloroflexota bacterium]